MGNECCRGEENETPRGGSRGLFTVAPSATSKNNSDLEQRRVQKVNAKMVEWVNGVIQKGTKYSDPDFLPQISSIYDEQDTHVPFAEREAYGGIVWKRASQIFQDSDVFKDGVSPEDILQGYLGNGYLLTVLSAMSDQPEQIYDLFETKTINAAGIFLVYLYVNGVRTPVIVDDFIPVWAQNDQPIFAKAKDAELWVVILEKAWAKLHGTYCRTEQSSPFFVASHFMGIPSYSVPHPTSSNEQENFYAQLRDADRRNYMMIVSSQAHQREIANENGLIQGHSFELLSIFELEHEGIQERLMKLRNPWGYDDWAGDWSRYSTKWTPQLREQLGFPEDSEGSDGVFFMRFEDYVQEYKRTCICAELSLLPSAHAKVQYTYRQDKQLQTTRPAFFRFFLERDIDLSQETLTISVHQQGERLKTYRLGGDNPARHVPAAFSVFLFSAEGELLEKNKGLESFTPTLQPKSGILQASGEGYLIMVDSPWENLPTQKSAQQSYLSICVDLYCPGQAVYMRQESPSAGFEVIEEMIRQRVQDSPDLDTINKFEDQYENKVCFLEEPFFFNDWYGFMFYTNGSERKFLMEKNLQGCVGYKVVNRKVGTNKELISIAPGDHRIYLLKRTASQCKFIPTGKVLRSSDI